MEGTARRVQRAQEGATSILRFLLVSDDGASTAVEMRGSEIRGLLDDGDRVVMAPASEPPTADGLHCPARVQNLTTGSVVTAWRPTLVKRASKPLVTGLLSATISSVVTFVFGVIVAGGQGPTAGAPPGGRDGEPGTDWFPFESPSAILEILSLSAIVWLLWFAAFGWRRRRRGRVIWPVAPGILLGVTVGLWVFAVIDGSEVG
jgi:hypothetical protein